MNRKWVSFCPGHTVDLASDSVTNNLPSRRWLVVKLFVLLKILVELFVATFSANHCPPLLISYSEFVFADLWYRLFCFDFCELIIVSYFEYFLDLVTGISI